MPNLEPHELVEIAEAAAEAHWAAAQEREAAHVRRGRHTVAHDADQALTAICQRVEQELTRRKLAAPPNLPTLVRLLIPRQ